MVFQSVRPYVPMLALLSISIVFLGRFWWPGEVSAWAGSSRFALLFFLIVYVLSGELGRGLKSKALLFMMGLLVVWVFLNFLLVGGDAGVLRRSIVLIVFVCAVAILKDACVGWLRHLFMIVVVVSAVAALVTLIYQLRRSGLDFQYRAFRLSDSGIAGFAQFGNPIISGMYMAFSGLIAFWCALCAQRKLVKFFWFVCFLVIAFYVLLTYARTAWLAMSLGGVAMLIFKAKRDFFIFLIGVVFAIVVSLIFWRFPDVLSVELERGSTNRTLIWKMVLEDMAGDWWLGHGAGSSMKPMTIPGQQVVNTHSLYLEVLYQYGVVGLSIFVSSLLLALRQFWMEFSEVSILGFCLLLGCIGAMFFDLYSFIHSPNLVWLWVWFPLGLALACSKDGAQ